MTYDYHSERGITEKDFRFDVWAIRIITVAVLLFLLAIV